MQPASRQRLSKQTSAQAHWRHSTTALSRDLFPVLSVRRLYNEYLFKSESVGCSKGTGIIKKSPTPPFYQRRNNVRREKTKVLTLNKYMARGPSGARLQEWPYWLVAGLKLLLCSALLRKCGGFRRARENWEASAWCLQDLWIEYLTCVL
jgi:hypothetical protein